MVSRMNSGGSKLHCIRIELHSYFATDFDENSKASRMNSGGSIDLNSNGQ